MAYTSDTANVGSGGPAFNVDRVAGVDTPVAKISHGVEGTITPVTAAAPLPVVASATDTLVGAVTETAPATDTASSGLNGRLQRIAQRITSLITALGSPFQAGGALGAGSALIGKVGIDQTTPGTTNAVSAVLTAGNANVGDVDIASIAAGDNNIGNVDIVTVPTDPFGVNADAASATGSISAKLRSIAATGIPITGTVTVGSHAVTNAGTFAVQPKGSSATNVAIADNPVNLGVQAVSSENAAVTTARQVQLVADLVGKLIVLPYANPENFVSGAITTAMTGTTSTSLLAAPAAGLRNYITQITISNAHATVGTDVIIQDGSNGTTLYTIPAASVYGGAVLTFPTPLRQPTTATAIYCANVSSGASVKASASGYKGA